MSTERPQDAAARIGVGIDVSVNIGIDVAMINLNRLQALAALLSDEDGTHRFADLDSGEQAAIFGFFEDIALGALAALKHEPDADART
jgi:hypothetical protein